MVMQWNAEGVFRKEDELQHLLLNKDIDICCIQETHLKEGKNFKIRGYQKPFRLDRPDISKGGVPTLVRNTLHVIEVSTHLDGAEYQCFKVRSKSKEVTLVNYYCRARPVLVIVSVLATIPLISGNTLLFRQYSYGSG